MKPGILDGDTEIKDSKITLFQEKSKMISREDIPYS